MDTNTTSTTNASPNGEGALPFTPLLAPSAIFTTIYGVFLVLHAVLAYKFRRYYGYAIGMFCGILLEFLGYIAKVMLSNDRRDKNGYIMYIIGLTLGPTFLSSSLYLGISMIQRHDSKARIKYIGPRLFATLFILGDFACLSFIGCGGSLAAIYADSPVGIDLMIAGLATQVLFTAIFCLVLFIVYRKIQARIRYDRMRWYMLGASVAAACLFIRSCWRVAELSDGFNGPLASKEGIFIALDSLPMVAMSALLTLLHPQYWFGHGSQPNKLVDEYNLVGNVRNV